jgi:hypothetical protein
VDVFWVAQHIAGMVLQTLPGFFMMIFADSGFTTSRSSGLPPD